MRLTIGVLLLLAAQNLTQNVTTTIKTKTWYFVSQMVNYTTDNYFITEVNSVSKAGCAERCTLKTACMSFFYTKSNGNCRLHSYTIDVQTALPNAHFQSGAMLYADKCNHAGFLYIRESTKYYKTQLTHTTSWSDAKDFCERNGGSLMQVESLIDLQKVKAALSQLLSHISMSDVFWLDGHRVQKTNEFKWSDGSTLDALLWAKGEPQTDAVLVKDCVLMVPGDGFTLGAIECVYNQAGHKLYPLCECTL